MLGKVFEDRLDDSEGQGEATVGEAKNSHSDGNKQNSGLLKRRGLCQGVASYRTMEKGACRRFGPAIPGLKLPRKRHLGRAELGRGSHSGPTSSREDVGSGRATARAHSYARFDHQEQSWRSRGKQSHHYQFRKRVNRL